MCKVKYAVNRISCFSISAECSYLSIFNPESNGIFYLSCRTNRCDIRYNLVYRVTLVPPNTKKIEALRSCGVLNRHPEKVRDPLFAEHDFFDPHDLVQLKYETIRAIEIDRRPIAHAALDFGLSRPTIYVHRKASDRKASKGFFPKSGVQKSRASSPRKSTLTSRSLLYQSPISKLLRWFREFEDASVSFSIPAL
jgi:hypothetical protein